MKLNNIELHTLLTEKGISNFYHANTVSTSITFIENGGLLSRGDIETYKLHQTQQDSDKADKEQDVWEDIFLDTVDIHGFFPRQNLYGPVTFEFDISFLLETDLEFWVTKNNPMFWQNKLSANEKYFQSVEELRETWDNFQRHRKMFTIRKPGKPILFDSLLSITLDNPEVMIYDTVLYDCAKIGLNNSTKGKPELRQKLRRRNCSNCFCKKNYLTDYSANKLASFFLPKEHPRFAK